MGDTGEGGNATIPLAKQTLQWLIFIKVSFPEVEQVKKEQEWLGKHPPLKHRAILNTPRAGGYQDCALMLIPP